MNDQPETRTVKSSGIDMPHSRGVRPARKSVKPAEILILAGAIATLSWGTWVTKTIIDQNQNASPEFVQLQLQGIITEYLQLQARSASDETIAARETSRFMAKLDQLVAEASRNGKVVLVREAVLGGDVPDITESVKAQLYLQVPRPQPIATKRARGEMENFLASGGADNGPGQ